MSIEHDWRFAVLVARTWTEPALRSSYLADPHRVLAEAGIELTPGSPAPVLPTETELDLVVEHFDTLPGPSPAAGFCLSLADDAPAAGFCLSLADDAPAAGFCLSPADDPRPLVAAPEAPAR